MKKLFISLVLVALLFAPVFVVKADTATTDDITALQTQLVTLLTQLISQLQAQLATMISAQQIQQTTLNQQAQTIQQQQDTLNTIAQNTTPVQPPSQPVIESPVPQPLSISCSPGVFSADNINVLFTATASGGDGTYQYGWNCATTDHANGTFDIHPADNFTGNCFSGTDTINMNIHNNFNVDKNGLTAYDLDNNGIVGDETGSNGDCMSPVKLYVQSGEQIKRVCCTIPLN